MLSRLPKTWLILPCYNEALRFPVEEVVRFARDCPAIRICFVNDGSVDQTEAMLQATAERIGPRAIVLSLPRNCGKAEAVRRGILHVLAVDDAEFIGYWDADLATPLDEVPRFLAAAEENPGVEFLAGSRVRRMGAEIRRRAVRHLLGRVFATAASLILKMPVYDTQCGAKMLRGELARDVFAAPLLTKWCFDVEVFARVAALRGSAQAARCILEVPLLRWTEVGGSKLRLRHWVKAVFDLGRIYMHYRRDSRAMAGQPASVPLPAQLSAEAELGGQEVRQVA